MGGGAAMRAASRVASFGVNGGGRRLQEQSNVSSTQIQCGQPQRVAPIVCDWELIEERELPPRVVFSGGALSLQEAIEATSDLKHALHRDFFSNSVSSTAQESTLLRSGHAETKACITSESALVHSVPKPIFHAFSMLTECPEAQGVVASLASDKNVWDAVMQNEKVIEFIKNQQNGTVSEEVDTNTESLFPESECFHDLRCSEESQVDPREAGNEFMGFIEKVKITVTDIVNSLSGFFQNIFGSPTEETIPIDPNGNATLTAGLGASFMALAVLAIMVAVLKRG